MFLASSTSENYPLPRDGCFWLLSTITYHLLLLNDQHRTVDNLLQVCTHLLLIWVLWSKASTCFWVSSYGERLVDMGNWQSCNATLWTLSTICLVFCVIPLFLLFFSLYWNWYSSKRGKAYSRRKDRITEFKPKYKIQLALKFHWVQ